MKTVVNASDTEAMPPRFDSDSSGVDTDNARIRRSALEWTVVFSSKEVTKKEKVDFENWIAADQRHASAWANVSRIFSGVQSLNANAAGKVLRSKPVSFSRRNVLFGLGLVAGTAMLTYTVSRSSQWQRMSADYRTATGERRKMHLPDGTQLVINTGSAVNVRFDSHERRLIVVRGEILVTTARDSAPIPRPFIVETAAGDIRAIGTRFSVRSDEDGATDDVSVHVFEGAVEVGPRNVETKVLVHAGQQISFNRDGTSHFQTTEDIASAWSEGKLIAERMRLADFLSELSRYRPGIIRCNREVADIVVSGVYPLADTDAVLQSLVQAFPVRVTMTTKYWVSVSAI